MTKQEAIEIALKLQGNNGEIDLDNVKAFREDEIYWVVMYEIDKSDFGFWAIRVNSETREAQYVGLL